MIEIFHEMVAYPKFPVTLRDNLDVLYPGAIGKLAEIHLSYEEANNLLDGLEKFLISIDKLV